MHARWREIVSHVKEKERKRENGENPPWLFDRGARDDVTTPAAFFDWVWRYLVGCGRMPSWFRIHALLAPLELDGDWV